MADFTLRLAALAMAVALTTTTQAADGAPTSVTYLGNAGVLVEQGEAKVLFDPLFRLDHDFYRPVPDHLENALVSGEPPFDGVDAVMISHYHLDHFSPNLVLNYLLLNPTVQLYAPEQAVAAMQQFVGSQEESLMERVTGLKLNHHGNPFSQEAAEYQVEILRIPHSGWPDQSVLTQNLVYRVSFTDGTSVLHLGDSAAQYELFERFAPAWSARRNDLVLAPYWFQQETQGRKILSDLLQAGSVLGIHVPADVPEAAEQRSREYRDLTLLLTPGVKNQLPERR
jgi:L-ascorbate metabolism protein UlaG (beta-lactamase superfamily)